MAKHSPAPWRHRRRMIVDARGHGIAATFSGAADDLAQAGANDALIAAAPDLLAALRDIVSVFGDDEIMDAARAAIRKAMGGDE